MLDHDTKERIKTLKQILVGRLPDPTSQVEQITNGLIYKFMYDMDCDSVEMGGKASFFVGEYEQYSWEHLFDPKLGGVERVDLYSDAIKKMCLNPKAPPLFREIFKNSFVPFTDASTLNLFLKEIDQFHYSHSEKLGDAFEYLLSFVGSQGDAGQFRTPRHIIDFIVEVVNPKKGESILDPACGTSGFLISSYKHILAENSEHKSGDKLDASDRKQLAKDLVGYDISPEMVRISLVNMYLHGFSSPKIYEYDTLSSQEKWDDYYDIVLANPPFFSPKGGIRPHSGFGIQTKKAELLFVDYIINHLSPYGRAGIIVPEGIIFQSGSTYKTLRKFLVEKYLVGVISLPAGVFQPYSNVKTSILILNQKLNSQNDTIFFTKIQNDGYSLTVQRTPSRKNDIPEVLNKIKRYLEGEIEVLDKVQKSTILDDEDISLSSDLYLNNLEIRTDYDLVGLPDLVEFVRGVTFAKKDQLEEETETSCKVVTTRASQADGIVEKDCYVIEKHLVKDQSKFLKDEDILISLANSLELVGRTTFVEHAPEDLTFGAFMGVLRCDKNKINPRFLHAMLNSNHAKHFFKTRARTTTSISNLSFGVLQNLEIPLPPLTIQNSIVDEIIRLQDVIDDCRDTIKTTKNQIGEKVNKIWSK